MKVSAFTNGAPAQLDDILGAVRGGSNVRVTVGDVLSAGVKVTDLGNLGATETLDTANGVYQRGTLNDDTAITLDSIPASGTGWGIDLELKQDATGGREPTIEGLDVSEYVSPLPYSSSVFNINAAFGDALITPKYTAHDCPVYLDFINDLYLIEGVELTRSAVFLTQRASAATYIDSAGLLTNFSSGILRVGDLGALIEPNRTNVVLWNRDLTNAAWTKSNVTAAKDQTGIDGVANSATRLTATAGNGTCLQAITLASSARFQTAYVKRITGSGVVEMTMDNGSTWTPITVTGSWARVSIPTQTLANPTVGFRVVTNGDEIAVDLVDNENGTFATSPLATTSASTNRNADVVTLANFTAVPTTAIGVVAIGTSNAISSELNAIVSLDDTTSNERMTLRQTGSAGGLVIVDGGVTQASISVSGVSYATRNRFVASITANSIKWRVNSTNGTTDTSATLPTATRVAIGLGAGANAWSGYIEKLMIFNRVLTDAEMVEVAAL